MARPSPGGGAEQARDKGERRLHLEGAAVGRDPLRKGGAIVEMEPCGLFGQIDVDGGAEKDRRGEQSGETQHCLSPFTPT
ncbi:hypothetical protein D3C72_2277530 [compost metagenome]